MNERELDLARVDTYKKVVEFARDAVQKEIKKLSEKQTELNSVIHRMLGNGVKYSDTRLRKLQKELKITNALLEKLRRDLDYLNRIISKFNTEIISFNDPEDLRIRKKELLGMLDDINNVSNDAERVTRTNDLQHQIEIINRNFETRIKRETDSKKIQKMVKEKDSDIEAIQKRLSKLDQYVNLSPAERQLLISNLNTEIARISSMPSKTSEEKLEEAILLVKPLFTKYENKYGGVNVEKRLINGESLFKYIMKSTDTYAKMGDEIDKLENKLEAINSVRKSKGKEEIYIGMELKGEAFREMLPYRIRDMKQKQAMISKEQKIIMLKRQQVIDKRNKKISKLEGTSMQLKDEASINNHRNPVLKGLGTANATRKKFKAWRTDVRVKVLRNMPIFLKSSRTILFLEQFKNEFLRRSTFEYDIKNEKGFVIHKKGDMDYRLWQDQVLERMENEEEFKKARQETKKNKGL